MGSLGGALACEMLPQQADPPPGSRGLSSPSPESSASGAHSQLLPSWTLWLWVSDLASLSLNLLSHNWVLSLTGLVRTTG